MHSSPGTPAGWGRRPASSTYTRVPAIGRPMGTVSAPGATACDVDQTVVSVGP